MDKYQIFAAWAPPASSWSAWAKPAPFAHVPVELAVPPLLTPRLPAGAPPARARRALVVAASGPATIEHGLALAAAGYQPVPLFNACPMPPVFTADITWAAVDARAIVDALVTGATPLGELAIPADAPPAFLVDAKRMTADRLIGENTFDNRSVVFASDFPSVHFLRRHHLAGAVLLHDAGIPVGGDLLHALRPWKSAGLPVDTLTLDGAPLAVTWPWQGFWGQIFWRAFAMLRLRRHAAGGYGAFVPESSGG